jgi:pimeloyl-ACP methyl ester carboxylesterase
MPGHFERIPYIIAYAEKAGFKDTYGGVPGKIAIECQLLKPPQPAKTVVIFSHPIGGGTWLPMTGALAKAGVPVIYANTRYRGNDSALIMEKCVIDLGAAVRHAKEKLGFDRVVLGGWSGGGALSLFYQAQAERPTITMTPAGDPVDLIAQELIPADAIALVAAHLSRNRTLTEWLDPSIIDEARPFDRDRTLNIYDPLCPDQPPYSPEFVARFRTAQIARNRRITAWVKRELAALKAAGRDDDERGFVVNGTMCDLRWLDPAQDPNDRPANWCMLGDPRQANDGVTGLARFSTLRSWLSQWSYDDSNADGLKCAAQISVPLLGVENGADDACTPSHLARLFAAAPQVAKDYHLVQGAGHYYIGQPDKADEAARAIRDWIVRTFGDI